MAQNKHQDLPAPSGMDATSDPTLLAETRCAYLQNLLADRAGILRTQVSFADVASLPTGVDGVAWYYGATAAQDRLIVIAGGAAYSAALTSSSFPLTFGPLTNIGGGFNTGKRVRSAQYRDELLFVQDGGLQPRRFNGTAIYQLGVTPPAAPGVVLFTPTSGSSNKAGTITYKTTYYDEKFRESGLSTGTSITFTSGMDALVSVSFGTDPQIQGVYIYANTNGGTVFYRIATLTKTAGVTFYEDNKSDNTVSSSLATQAAQPGENGVPNPASVIAVHKLRVWLNDATNASFLQFSGLDNAIQWSSVNFSASDGERVTLTQDAGSVIESLTPVGSTLVVLRRRLLYLMLGDDPTTFTFRPLHSRSAIAPDSVVRCDNVLMFASDDGFYQIVYSGGSFDAQKVSKEIEALYLATPNATLTAAVGWYVDNAYYCQMGATTYVYNFDVGGWVTLSLAGQINGSITVASQGQPQFTLLARGDKNAVSVVDLQTPSQSVANIIYATRSFDGSDERKRSTRKRAFRTTVFGTASLGTSLTITLTIDGLATSGTLSDSDPNQNILGRQVWPPYMKGTNQQIQIAGTGVGLSIRDILHEYTDIG